MSSNSCHGSKPNQCFEMKSVFSINGFVPEGHGGGLIAIAPTVFREEAAMNAALASPDTARVMADVKKVTAVEPQRSVGRPM